MGKGIPLKYRRGGLREENTMNINSCENNRRVAIIKINGEEEEDKKSDKMKEQKEKERGEYKGSDKDEEKIENQEEENRERRWGEGVITEDARKPRENLTDETKVQKMEEIWSHLLIHC